MSDASTQSLELISEPSIGICFEFSNGLLLVAVGLLF